MTEHESKQEAETAGITPTKSEPSSKTVAEQVVGLAISGASAGALVGMMLVPGIGSILGAAVGALLGAQLRKKAATGDEESEHKGEQP